MARTVANGGALVNCISRAKIVSSAAGGVVNNVQSGAYVMGCVFYGNIDDVVNQGAIAGSVSKSEVKYCYSLPIEDLNEREELCTFEGNPDKVAAGVNAKLGEMEGALGLASGSLCKVKVENGQLVLEQKTNS